MIDRIKAEQTVILNERNHRRYRGDQPLSKIKDHTVLLIDDGIATVADDTGGLSRLSKNWVASV